MNGPEYFSCNKEDLNGYLSSSSASSGKSLSLKKIKHKEGLSPSAKFAREIVKFVKSGSVWKPALIKNSSDLCSVDNKTFSETMAMTSLGKKRKRESSNSEQEVDLQIKKKKLQNNYEESIKPNVKAVKRTEIHAVSSSDDESAFQSSVKTPTFDKTSIKSEAEECIQESTSSTIDNLNTDESFSSMKKSKSKNHSENKISVEYQSNIEVLEEPSLTRDDEDEVLKLSSLFTEDFISKNNIWTLQCPGTMNCADLVGQSLTFNDNGSSKLKINDSEFEVHSYRNHTNSSATLAVPSYSNNLRLYKIPISGNLTIEEVGKVKNSRSNFIVQEQERSVELPQNLRIRHPLFGLDFKKQCKTPTSPKKSSKKKKLSQLPEIVENGITDLLDETPGEFDGKKHKRKKKKKYSISD